MERSGLYTLKTGLARKDRSDAEYVCPRLSEDKASRQVGRSNLILVISIRASKDDVSDKGHGNPVAAIRVRVIIVMTTETRCYRGRSSWGKHK
jgi:hypothetical protein